MKPLVIIPARGGSKGIPGKNIKELAGRPLIAYTIDAARKAIKDDCRILVSTDSKDIAETVRNVTGLCVPFMRPASLATDTSGSREVILHAMEQAAVLNIDYDCVVLLQPTSPLRTVDDITHCMDIYNRHFPDIDMAVTVTEASSNPYYNCYETGADGYLRISKGDGTYTRRQDAPKAWEYNGAVYVINPESIKDMPLGQMPRKVPCPMPPERSLDLDTPIDWIIAETIMANKPNSQY